METSASTKNQTAVMNKPLLSKIKTKQCDCCGKPFSGISYPVVDANFNVQKGLIQCGCAFEV